MASMTSAEASAPITAKAVEPAPKTPVPTNAPRFAELKGLIDPILLQTITDDMKFETMTEVQAATIRELIPSRSDILAQAKTGTGKTVAFLIPAIQTLLEKKPKTGSHISLLVISPTRELAIQIADEAKVMLSRFPGRRVCLAIGGTNKNAETKRILGGCDILVATPGRLIDHITDEETGQFDTPVCDKLQQLDTLVLDEADRMLDMGFLPSLKDIVKCLPDKASSGRQGMLFSATIAPHVEKVAHLVCDKGYKFISTIPKGEVNTHERVPQQLVLVPTFSDLATALVGSLRQEMAHIGRDKFKAIVFAPTAAQTDFYAEILRQCKDLVPVLHLHSRMTQSKRTRGAEEYRQAKTGILVATDVVARGLDFPAVTSVFQVGLPADKESYIHRLGRTARAGAEGRGIFILAEPERFFPERVLKDIKFISTPADLSAHENVLDIVSKFANPGKTYQAWLGYYKVHVKSMRWDNTQLVAEANKLALNGLGAAEIPALEKKTIGKMGLKGVKGLVIGPSAQMEERSNKRQRPS